VDLKVPIVISDELTEDVVTSTGLLDLASGEIQRIEYRDYDVAARGLPWEADDYEFTSGMLSHEGKEVEFKVDVNRVTGQYSVSTNELLEIKVRAAALFAGVSGADMLASVDRKEKAAARPAAEPRAARGGKKGRTH
jgi:hypothetical protein